MRTPPVIIVRRPRRVTSAGIHGNAWKVAYADFVTAMMAFFLVMWLVGQGQSVRQAVAGYFRAPAVFVDGSSDARNTGKPASDAARMPRSSETTADRHSMIVENDSLARTAGRLRDLLGQMPEFRRLGKQIEIQTTSEGLRVELLEASDATFFDTGSAALKPDTVRILGTIARELGRLENDVVLEGHTDSRPYTNADGYSNWELSADRANAARRVMERSGLHPRQVKGVRGYADTRLRIAALPHDPRNRRVTIIVQGVGGGPPTDLRGDESSPAAPSVDR